MPEVAVPAMEEAHLSKWASAGRRGLRLPQMAEVWLDGRFASIAPLQMDQIPTGRHYLRLVSPGYQNDGRLIDVAPHKKPPFNPPSPPPVAQLSKCWPHSTRQHKLEPTGANFKIGIHAGQLGPDVTVFGILADGITGEVYQEAQKSFSTFPRPGEVENWLASSFRKPQYSIPKVQPDAQLQPSDPGYVPPPVATEGINDQIRSGYIFSPSGLASPASPWPF